MWWSFWGFFLIFLEDLILSCATSTDFPTLSWQLVQESPRGVCRAFGLRSVLRPQGHFLGPEIPHSLSTQTRTLQNFHLGLPQQPGMSCHTQHGAPAKLVPLVGRGGLEFTAGIKCAKPVWGMISLPCARPGCHNHHALCGHSKYL